MKGEILKLDKQSLAISSDLGNGVAIIENTSQKITIIDNKYLNCIKINRHEAITIISCIRFESHSLEIKTCNTQNYK